MGSLKKQRDEAAAKVRTKAKTKKSERNRFFSFRPTVEQKKVILEMEFNQSDFGEILTRMTELGIDVKFTYDERHNCIVCYLTDTSQSDWRERNTVVFRHIDGNIILAQIVYAVKEKIVATNPLDWLDLFEPVEASFDW